jgi:PPOX class probable F420-dependent enzyme
MSTLPADVRPFFSGTHIAHLATLLPDGSPHSVPMWVDLEDERIAILTSPESRKGRNLDGDSRVALSVTDKDNWTSMATVRGTVVGKVDGAAGWAIIDRISQKYIGQPYPLRTDRVVYLIEPQTAQAFSFG